MKGGVRRIDGSGFSTRGVRFLVESHPKPG
jgi:hypothetical protein